MIQRGPAVCLLLSFCITPASAGEWLSGNDLEQSCDVLLEDPGSADGMLCLAFIQGFIAGADTTEHAVHPGSATTSSGDETFAERAARTRLGTLRLQQMRASYARYCIDNAVTAVEVVDKVTAYLEDHPAAADLTAHDAVREALAYSFPCDS